MHILLKSGASPLIMSCNDESPAGLCVCVCVCVCVCLIVCGIANGST